MFRYILLMLLFLSHFYGFAQTRIFGFVKGSKNEPVSEQEGLFIRGGSSEEAKQFIDGALVRNPYFGSAPDLPSRSRFDASLFRGFSFSSEGYSALYGDAISSVLIMETIDMPERSADEL